MKTTEALLSKCSEVSQTLKVLAHPDRLKLLCLLSEGERTVGEIVEECGSSQSQISQFLSRMKLEGLVASEREGQQVVYRIADPQVRKLIRALKEVYSK